MKVSDAMTEERTAVTLDVQFIESVNFSFAQLGRNPVDHVTVSNNAEAPLEGAILRIDSAFDLLTDVDLHIPVVAAGEEIDVDCADVKVNANEILKLTEKTVDGVDFDLLVSDRRIAHAHVEMTFWAFDQWDGTLGLLPAFVTPNHPLLAQVLVRASEHLRKWTGNSALDGYQSEDWQRTRFQAAAVFRALQESSIVYAGPPASFDAGQRIRLVDAVLEQHLGTSLDLAILYASCLEAIDLRPLIVLIKGQAYAGVWLEEDSFPEIVEEDISALAKRCAKGVNQMTVVECTMFAKDSKATFDDAEGIAQQRLLDYSKFICAIDVHRARQSQVLPLPHRVKGLDGWEVEAEEDDSLARATVPEKSDVSTAVLDVKGEEKTKKQIWERSLLDLSIRNNLVNMRMGASIMPIPTTSINDLEDALALDADLVIAPWPKDVPPINDDPFQPNMPEEVDDLLHAEFEEGRLRTAFTQKELEKNLGNLYRSSRSAIAETGANTLFLALGALRWIDAKRGNESRLAPLMLFPVDITRKSAAAGYTIRLRDDEPQINFSLLEMLRTDYDIVIEGLDPLPADEAGVDTRLVLNTFASKIMDQPNWEILECAALGLFSFAQFVMWNDIRNREDDLRKNKIVDSMMEGHLTWQPEQLDPDAAVDPDDLLLPVETDASQMLAVKAALDGKSFVLHGPPGTGKSQTITAIIANMLADGRKVLFVAEKMAALEVVEKRLDALGIGPFALEAFSTKATKSHVFDQIQAAAEIGARKADEGYARKADEARTLRGKLDEYAQALRTPNAAGLSLREQICRYQELLDDVEPMTVPASFMDGIEAAGDFTERMNDAEILVATASPFAPLREHPLYFVTSSRYSQSLRRRAPDVLDSYIDACRALRDAVDALPRALRDRPPTSWDDLSRIEHDISVARDAAEIPAPWRDVDDRRALLDDIELAAEKADELAESKAALSDKWEPSFFETDLKELKQSWVDANTKGVFGKGKAISKVVASLSLASKEPLTADDVEPAIKELDRFRALESACAEHEQRVRPYLEDFGRTGSTRDWNAVMQNVATVRRIDDGQQDKSVGRATIDAVKSADPALLDEFCTRLSEAERRYAGVTEILGPAPSFDPASQAETTQDPSADRDPDTAPDEQSERLPDDWITWQIDGYEKVRGNLDDLHDWMALNDTMSHARDEHLDTLVDYLGDHAAAQDTVASFKCGVYRTMCALSIDDSQVMNAFSRSQFDALIDQYARADEELRELARREIYYRIAARTPDLAAESARNPQAVKLQKALRSRGRKISIRSVISDSGDLIRGLCPCFLMSPLSVAAYLEPGSEQFDLIIFDEASQLQTCKAVGALSRAKSAIVVGDPRQMPPTSFFQGKSTDEDFEEMDDLESVLEDCLALNMPQTYLRWHYRSQHESLIAFSNKKFYESKMFTFPSADDRKSRVEFVFVGGTFERGSGKRVNRKEAEAIVDELKKRAHDPQLSERSGGVITFNLPQMKLIDDLLQHACDDDPVLDKWANDGDEPVFVKNLENVQGDERDVILFSITYGPDQDGKLSMNFGPINNEGGWRRLNVAVTRARTAMKVFSSLQPADIDLNRTTSNGPGSLKAFLEFAQKGTFNSVSASEMSTESADDAIACAVCASLAEAGYETRRNVGRSSFRVDIGVVDPDDPQRYIAAILLDGASYEIANSTRDREISQPGLLKRLGWNVYRIWAIDWWENRDSVLDDLMAFVEQARLEKPQAEADAEEAIDADAEADAEADINVSQDLDRQDHVEEPRGVDQRDSAAQSTETADTSLADEQPTSADDESTATAQPVPANDDTETDEQPTETAQAAGARQADSVDHSPATMQEPADIPNPAVKPKREPYEVASLELPHVEAAEFLDIDDAEIADAMVHVIETEAPINQTLLYRRMAKGYGLAKVGARIQDKLDAALRKTGCVKVKQAGRTIVWRRDQDPKTYLTYRVSADDEKRTFDQLPLEEVMAAVIAVLDEKGPSDLDDLVKDASLKLGYNRLTSAAKSFFKRGITLAVRRNLVEKDGNMCTLRASST